MNTGELLLDTRLRKTFEMHTLTGNGLCPEHKKLSDDGYVALVEADPKKSTFKGNGNMDPSGAYRTGVILHMRRTVARNIFNIEIPDNLPLMFIDPEATAKIKAMMPDEEKEGD
jgi:hypothetical protein